MNITLKQLAIFVSTARLTRISNAADELCLTQSAASQSLKEFENNLGYQVFNRFGRRLILNDHGREILPKAIQMLELQTQLQQPLSNELQGHLNVAASVTTGSYLLPKILAQFVKLHPKVSPTLVIGNSDDVITRLAEGQAHIGLIEAPITHQHLSIYPWRQDQLIVFCMPDNPLIKEKSLSIKTMSEQRWILREQGSGTRAVFVNAMQQQGGIVDHCLNLSRQEAIKEAVRANLGLGVLSALAIKQEIELGLFVELPTPLNLNRQLSIVQSQYYQKSLLVDEFVNYLNDL
ncbi:LysR substrate-binding domain-containing protein [Thalassotalea profundi]|uniref:LysR family transcriptional regulator n=1 Tax=Thalassotalea profundi TaxID=2036687 RepID=A0ABQ3IS95_9GAMM|nr:LysR substrate-binding domain-containing protein [Thalassotalea profundi]GHE88437.1 LysR family transcriptional regulator [Thalassotalea profundi]